MSEEKPPEYRDPIDLLPGGIVRPKGRRKQSKKARRARQVQIAAALGKGGALREIAEETGHSKTMVVHVRDKIDSGKDPYLAKVRERARDELSTAAIDALRLNISKQKEALEAGGQRLSDMAQSARSLNEIAFPSEQAGPVVPLTVTDLGKLTGAAAAELLLQLKAHEERTARPERLVDGERIE